MTSARGCVLVGAAAGLLGLGLLRAGLAPPAPRAPPACPAPVVVAGPGGDRVGCPPDLPSLVRDAARRAGCRAPVPGAAPAGTRIVVHPGDGVCGISTRPLGGAERLALGLPLELNGATAADLARLDGIGPARARALVRHRDRRDGFTALSEVLEAPGVGPGLLARLRAAGVVVEPLQGRTRPKPAKSSPVSRGPRRPRRR